MSSITNDTPIGQIIAGLGSEEVLAQLGSAGISTVGELKAAPPSRFFSGRELADLEKQLSFGGCTDD